MRCAHCQHDNSPGAKFCSECGKKLEAHCPACGVAIVATAKFCPECGSAVSVKSPSPTQPTAVLPREERRWATLLFADLSDFTSMSERLDPEDVKALAHHCAQRMSEEVQRFGGTVITIAGDQVMAAFGAPVAHEDDAERAVRAALAMRDCALSSDREQPLRLHIGINTGEVMAGLIGPQERRDYAVMGDTTNVAARLMSAAPAGAVLVGEETWRATRRAVRYRELPPLALKGKERPVLAWEALEAAELTQARPLGTAPLVGRDQELALLSDVWLKVVREARPHLVTVIGEPGIGKSRLTAEFERRFCADALVLHGRCLPYGEALGYWALAAMIKEAAGIGPADDLGAARLRLSALVARAVPDIHSEEMVDLAAQVALLTGLDLPGESSPAKVDQRTLHGSVRRFFECLARQKPVCLMFEDIHWADAALLDLIEFLASRTKDAPLLVVAQARPALFEQRSHWGAGMRAFTSLSLEPLSDSHGRELISRLCQERGLPESIVAQVGQGAGGNPLFAEELVLMIAERGSDAGVPSAIKALIASRLDALPAEQRRLLQIAAVFGKVFWRDGIQALGVGEELSLALEALEQKDLVRVQPSSQFRGGQEYLFKHDLIRDAAYETLPRVERRTLHGKIADWLHHAAADKLEVYFDQLAHHALHAGQEARAIGYLAEAAQRAQRMSAYVEEARLLLSASEIAQRLGQTEVHADLLGKRGTAFVQLGRWPEARADLEAALAGLSETRMERRAEVLRDLSMACIWTMDAALATQYASEASALAKATNRETLAIEASALIATAEHLEGNLRKGWETFRQTLGRGTTKLVPAHAYAPHTLYMLGQYKEGADLAQALVQTFRGKEAHALMQAFTHLALNLMASGRYREAADTFEEARRHGREYESWPMLARSIAMSGGYHLELFDFAGAESLAEEARELAGSANFPAASYSAGVDLLFNYVRRGEVSRAEALLPAVATGVENSLNWHRWLWRLRLAQVRAELFMARGQFNEALHCTTTAVADCRQIGRVKYEVLGMIVQASALRAMDRTPDAITELRSAVDRARAMRDPVLFLRAAVALLAIDGDDSLLRETNLTVDRIRAALPDTKLRLSFDSAEPLALLRRWTGFHQSASAAGAHQLTAPKE